MMLNCCCAMTNCDRARSNSRLIVNTSSTCDASTTDRDGVEEVVGMKEEEGVVEYNNDDGRSMGDGDDNADNIAVSAGVDAIAIVGVDAATDIVVVAALTSAVVCIGE